MNSQPLILFDWDLTLVDSEYQKVHVFLHAFFRSLPYSLFVLHKLKDVFHMNVVDFVKIMHAGSTMSKDDILDEYHKKCVKYSGSVVFKGLNVLRTLKKRGFKVGIITNDYAPNIRYICKKYRVKVEYIADTMLVPGKPSPVSLQVALKQFHVNPKNSFYIGDAPTDILSGKRAGVKTIALKTLYHSRKTLKRKHPDFIINDINDVIDIVTRKEF